MFSKLYRFIFDYPWVLIGLALIAVAIWVLHGPRFCPQQTFVFCDGDDVCRYVKGCIK